MKKSIFFFIFLSLSSLLKTAEYFHHSLSPQEKKTSVVTWEKKNTTPFDELIISWDAKRPPRGNYLIKTSLFINNKWSDWLIYAYWDDNNQYTIKDQPAAGSVKAGLAATSVLNGDKAYGFRVQINANEGANLHNFRTIHASSIDRSSHKVDGIIQEPHFIELKVPRLSQMSLGTDDKDRICSPTSLTAVMRYLKGSLYNPLAIAPHVMDTAWNIYGNWIFNTAQAIHELGAPWHCFVARLKSFNDIIEQLKKGYPVVVSVQGPLPGSASGYESGHLMVIRGYNPHEKKVLCMDPAFPTDDETYVEYNLDDFLIAWQRRLGLAYMFYK
jgi:hypothetical protein